MSRPVDVQMRSVARSKGWARGAAPLTIEQQRKRRAEELAALAALPRQCVTGTSPPRDVDDDNRPLWTVRPRIRDGMAGVFVSGHVPRAPRYGEAFGEGRY